jgi:hypothetical protein
MTPYHLLPLPAVALTAYAAARFVAYIDALTSFDVYVRAEMDMPEHGAFLGTRANEHIRRAKAIAAELTSKPDGVVLALSLACSSWPIVAVWLVYR